MCGIFGYCGSKPANLDKLKILGLWNITRGRDSCGYYYDGVLRHGIDKTKEWDNFIKDGTVINKPKSKGAKVFIGHTRAATKGAKTANNAHPFLVDGMVQVHNGTIENSFKLCDANDIDHSEITVDSLALAHLIKKCGWEILDKYIGYAANMWHFQDEPDSLYVYHGASRIKRDDEKNYEERPMFYMETKAGIYFSSLEASLMVIRDTEGESPKILSHNKVFKFTNGKLDKVVYKVERSDINLDLVDPIKKTVDRSSYSASGNTAYQVSMFGDGIVPKAVRSLIWREIKPAYIGESCDRVYWYRGRYYRQLKTSGNSIFEIALNGKIRISKGGYIITGTDNRTSRDPKDYYFVDGVMIKDAKSYAKIITCTDVYNHPLSHVERLRQNFAKHISKFSVYPVTNLEGEGVDIAPEYRFKWYLNEKIWTGSFTPKFNQRGYDINLGKLQKIHKPEGDCAFMKPAEPQKVLPALPEPKKQPVNFLPDVDPQKVKDILAYFHVTWLNLQEMEDLPLEVYAAIEAYVDDKLDQLGLDKLSQKEKDEYYNDFLKSTVKESTTLYENMDDDYKCNLQYYVEVGIDEVKNYKEEKSKTLDEKLQDISDKLVTNTGDIQDAEFEDIDDAPPADVFYESEAARKQWDDVINCVISLRKEGDKLQVLDKSDLAQEMAKAVYDTVDMFKAMACSTITKDREILKRMNFIDLPF